MRRLLAIGTALVLLAGCAEDPADGSAAAVEEPSPAAASPVPSDVASDGASEPAPVPSPVGSAPPAVTPGASTETTASPGFPGDAGQEVTHLIAVEVGRHDGFDRVVWRFDGPAPTYRAAYVDMPVTADGSGEPVELQGAAALQLIMTPASGVELDGEEVREIYAGPDRISGADAGADVVREVVQTGDFEATLSWAVGIDRRAPFTVTTLTHPGRIVVDITHG